jgi:hypothetical protein
MSSPSRFLLTRNASIASNYPKLPEQCVLHPSSHLSIANAHRRRYPVLYTKIVWRRIPEDHRPPQASLCSAPASLIAAACGQGLLEHKCVFGAIIATATMREYRHSWHDEYAGVQTSYEGLTTDEATGCTARRCDRAHAMAGLPSRLAHCFDYLAWGSCEAHRVLRTACKCTGMEERVAFRYVGYGRR